MPLFEGLATDGEFLVAVADKLEQRTVRRKVDVCEKGAVGVEMYFIVRGEAEVLLDLDSPPIATVMPGSFFGEGALLGGDGAVRNAYVRASKTMQLYVLTKQGLEDVFADYPDVEGTLPITYCIMACLSFACARMLL
jgi:CRP-like cAMP-binding protein